MKAVIMAGGKGTRLRPLTSNRPKPMIRIANKPCMEHILELLKRHGFEDVISTVGFMPEAIQDYFGDGSAWDVKMDYAVEDEPLGTAGSIKNAADRLDGRFLVVSGDALTDADLSKAVAFHEEKGAEATLVLKQVDDPSEFGIVVTGDDGRVERFLEKPDEGEVFSYTANTGIYVLEPSVLEDIPEGQEYDFSEELFPKLLDEGRPMYGYVMDGYWEDIGNLDQYMDAQRAVLSGEVGGVGIPGREAADGVHVGEDVRFEEEGIEAPVVFGNGVEVSPGARVGPFAVLADGVTVGVGAVVRGSVVAAGSSVGEGAELDWALVGRSCEVGARARLLEGSALGDGVRVGAGATVEAGVEVYPDNAVDEDATVAESIS